MSSIRVICPVHGCIKTIHMDCFWLGRPPTPEFDNAYCPRCGSKTTCIKDETSGEYKTYWASERAGNDRYR